MSQRELSESRSGLGNGQPRYDAFLSYSHAVDGRLAPAVQRGLHRLAKPWYRTRALRVFRDQLSLSANPDLWATITAALEGSRFFVLMASPEAAASPWVQREVEYWQKHRERETFLIVLTDGTIAWDHATGDFDWARTTALPTLLRGWFNNEPLWVPLGWAHRDTQLSVRHNRFRDAIATLAAPLHGIAKDDLDSEDVRQHRRTTRVRNGAIAVLALLTVVSVVLGLVAREQTNRAETRLQQAVSRELTSRSQTIGDTDPAVSKLLSVAAWRLNPTPEARAEMVAAFNRSGIADLPYGGGPVAFSPDRRTMATGGAGTVRLWDAVSHQPIGGPLIGHNGFVGRLAFSPDGNTLATGSRDGTVRLWNVAAQRQIGDPLIRDGGMIQAVTFGPDGETLAAGSSDGTVRLWDVVSRRQIGDPFIGYLGGTVPISPDGRVLAFGQDQTVQLWDIASHTQIGAPLTGFIGAVAAIAFSPDGAMLATGGADGAVRLWDVASQTVVGDPLSGFTGGIESLGVNAVAFSADGSTVTATGKDGTVRSWDVTSHAQIGDALSQGSGISWASFSVDSDTLATSSESGTVRLWDLTSRHHRGTPLASGGGTGYSAVFSPDGGTMAVGDDNGTVSLWDTASHAQLGTPLSDPTSAAITSMVFSPDGSRLAVGGHSSKVLLWDLETHAPIGDPFAGSGEPIAFSQNGHLLVTNDSISSEAVQVWDVASHARIAEFHPDGSDGADHFASAAVSRDGQLLATGSYDGKVQIWDLDTGRQIGDPLTGVVQPISSVAFSPDRLTLASGSAGGTVRLWDVATGAPIGDQLPGFTGARVLYLAFSPEGASLAAGAEDGTARLWDVKSRVPIGSTLSRHAEPIQSIAFSPDGRTLATSTGTSDPAVRLWNVPSLAQIDAVLCARLARSLTPDEWNHYVPDLPYRPVC